MTSEELRWAERLAHQCQVDGQWAGFFLGFGVGLLLMAVVSILLLARIGG